MQGDVAFIRSDGRLNLDLWACSSPASTAFHFPWQRIYFFSCKPALCTCPLETKALPVFSKKAFAYRGSWPLFYFDIIYGEVRRWESWKDGKHLCLSCSFPRVGVHASSIFTLLLPLYLHFVFLFMSNPVSISALLSFLFLCSWRSPLSWVEERMGERKSM